MITPTENPKDIPRGEIPWVDIDKEEKDLPKTEYPHIFPYITPPGINGNFDIQ